MSRTRTLFVGGVALVVVVALLVVRAALTGTADAQVEARPDAGVPRLAGLNRSDDVGGATVRAFLQASLSCTEEGARATAELAGPQAADVVAQLRAPCGARPRPPVRALEASWVGDSLDRRFRALWRVTAEGGESSLAFWVRQVDGRWTVERRCDGLCDRQAAGVDQG